MKPLAPSIRPTKLAWFATLVILIVFMSGCASVDPAPFTEFTSSLQNLRSGTDNQAAAATDSGRQELLQKVAAGEVSPADLQLMFDPSSPFTATYGFAEDEPGYVKLIRFRQGLSALNDSMVAYAQSLAVLAGGEEGGDILPTTAELDQMARDLNANAGTAAVALGVRLDPGGQALLSTAAIQLFKAHIEGKRRGALAEAIAEVQPRVAELSTAAQQAVRFLASLVQTDYDKKFLPLATASPADGSAILSLNETTQATLAALGSLAAGYGALPAAHRDLMAAASRQRGTFAGLVAFSSEASRLQGLVIELAKANAAAVPPPAP